MRLDLIQRDERDREPLDLPLTPRQVDLTGRLSNRTAADAIAALHREVGPGKDHAGQQQRRPLKTNRQDLSCQWRRRPRRPTKAPAANLNASSTVSRTSVSQGLPFSSTATPIAISTHTTLRTLGDSLRIVVSIERSQLRNRESAVRRLAERLDGAGRPRRRRTPTRRTASSVRRRLEAKRLRLQLFLNSARDALQQEQGESKGGGMGKSVTVTANDKGEYWVDVEVAGEKKKAIFDTGYTGTGGGGACNVDKGNWDKMKDKLKDKKSGGSSTDYKGEKTTRESGKGKVSIAGLDGAEAEKLISYSGGKDTLLGTTLFHNLNIMVIWDTGARTMTFQVKEKPKDEKPKDEKKRLEEELEEHNRLFDEQRAANIAYWQEAKGWIKEKFAGRYVLIADGELKRDFSTYDEAIETFRDFQRKGFVHGFVFRGDSEPPLDTESHALGPETGFVEEAEA